MLNLRHILLVSIVCYASSFWAVLKPPEENPSISAQSFADRESEMMFIISDAGERCMHISPQPTSLGKTNHEYQSFRSLAQRVCVLCIYIARFYTYTRAAHPWRD